ncbi:MAG: indole-3-glycerol-phosphate synthase [Anaerolineales bacterium]
MVELPGTMMKSCPLSAAILGAKGRGILPLVADIKPASPRDGELVGMRDAAELARMLVEAGACALSVVTEPKHFGGSLQTLRRVCEAMRVPVLRKDFFSLPEQIEETKKQGAGAILLTLATIPEPLGSTLYDLARELELEVVVEIHTRRELERALALSPTIIGINNRDILSLETDSGDVRVTEELAPLVPHGIVKVSESSLQTEEDILRAIRAGADAVLVGTAILRASDPAAFLSGLIRGVRV